MVLAALILVLQIFIAVTATIYDFWFRDKTDPDDYIAAHNIFTCWSLKKNFTAIFDWPKEKGHTIRSILGINGLFNNCAISRSPGGRAV